MFECVLPVTRTESHLAKQSYQLRMNAMDTDFQRRGFAFFLDRGFDFLLGLLDHLFDSGRMNPAVNDQTLQSDTRHFTADWIKPRDNDRFRCVINNQIHTRHRLECTDIPSLAADDSALHLIIRQLHNRNCSFRDMIRGAPLNCADDIFLRLFVCLFLCLRFRFLDHDSGIVFHILFNKF